MPAELNRHEMPVRKNARSWYLCCALVALCLCVAIIPAAALTAQVSQPILPKGVPLTITGQTDFPGEVAVWIIGKNYEDRRIITTTDGTFAEELFPAETTAELPSGQYFLIIEDTGPDGEFALDTATDGDRTMVYYQGMPLFALDDPGTIYSDTAMALSEALDRPEIDDAAMKMVFLVEEPWIRIDQVPTGHPGDLLRFSGSTNLPPGSEIPYAIYLVSASLPGDDDVAASGTIEVVKGGSHNYWYVDVDTGDLESETYVLTLDAGSGFCTATTTFILCDNRFTLPPTPAITVIPLQDEPEEVSGQPAGPESVPAGTTAYATIPTTDDLIYTTDDAVIWCSAIDGEYVTWAEKTEDEETNIYLYHIPTGTTRTIVEGARYHTATIDISGDHVAWRLRTDEPTVSDGIGLYTISNDRVEEIPFKYHIGRIAMDGDLIAFSGVDWSAADGDDNRIFKNIFLHSIATGTTEVLYRQSGHQIEPAIGDGYVAWRTEQAGPRDTITIYSLADASHITLTPPDGTHYAAPAVGGGRAVALLHYLNTGTSGSYKTEVVTTTLPGMETTTLFIPETPERAYPQSNGEWIVWAEGDGDSSGRIMVYDIQKGTLLGHITQSGWNLDIDDNHLIFTNGDELRGVSSLWLATFTGEEQPSPGETAAKSGTDILADALLIGFGVVIAGIAAAVVLWKRESR
jgi:hypothetical protein